MPAIKSKLIYNGRGIAFDEKGFQSFDNDTARNVIIVGVGNRSSPHIDNPKNNFLVLGKGPAECINDSVGAAEKNSVNFSKVNT